MTEDNTNMLDKPVTDLTLRDHLKVNGVVLAGMAGVATLFYGIGAFSEWRHKRKFNKQLEKVETTLHSIP